MKFTLFFKIPKWWIEFTHKNTNFHHGDFEKHKKHSIFTTVFCPFMVLSL